MVTLESRVEIPDKVLYRDLDGEAIVLNLSTGKYFGLDSVAARMWTLLALDGRIRSAFEALRAEYEVTDERLQADLLAFVDRLATDGLLQIDPI